MTRMCDNVSVEKPQFTDTLFASSALRTVLPVSDAHVARLRTLVSEPERAHAAAPAHKFGWRSSDTCLACSGYSVSTRDNASPANNKVSAVEWIDADVV
jgi:hypothetical protein